MASGYHIGQHRALTICDVSQVTKPVKESEPRPPASSFSCVCARPWRTQTTLAKETASRTFVPEQNKQRAGWSPHGKLGCPGLSWPHPSCGLDTLDVGRPELGRGQGTLPRNAAIPAVPCLTSTALPCPGSDKDWGQVKVSYISAARVHIPPATPSACVLRGTQVEDQINPYPLSGGWHSCFHPPRESGHRVTSEAE